MNSTLSKVLKVSAVVAALAMTSPLWIKVLKDEFIVDISGQMNAHLRSSIANHETRKLADKIVEQSRAGYPAGADETIISRQKDKLAGCIDQRLNEWLDQKTPDQYQPYSDQGVEAILRPIIVECIKKSENSDAF